MSISVSILDIWLNIFEKGGILDETAALGILCVGELVAILKRQALLFQCS